MKFGLIIRAQLYKPFLAICLLAVISSCQQPSQPAEENFSSQSSKGASAEIMAKRNSKSNSGGSSIITWSGLRWYVRSSTSYSGPGLNVFSGSANNVWVDSQGFLHLKITYGNGKWQCAEIFSEQNFGYGEYIFYTASQVDKIDKNAVLGLFTWDDNTFMSDGNSEIDVEFSKWGNSLAKPLLYSVQPTNGAKYAERNYNVTNFSLSGNYSTHAFRWSPSAVNFKSYYDWGYPTQWLAGQWDFLNTNIARQKIEGGLTSNFIVIPKPGATTKVHLNLWLYDANNNGYGDAPSNGQPVEVVIRGFEFRPL